MDFLEFQLMQQNKIFTFPNHIPHVISRLACRREIIIYAMCVHTCVKWVTQISLRLLQLHIFGKLLVLMNFYDLQYFWVW